LPNSSTAKAQISLPKLKQLRMFLLPKPEDKRIYNKASFEVHLDEPPQLDPMPHHESFLNPQTKLSLDRPSFSQSSSRHFSFSTKSSPYLLAS
jgi:hypothetical protein